MGRPQDHGRPASEISALLALPPAPAAAAVTAFWTRQEAIASERRELVRYLTGQLSGQEPAMYQIDLHSIGERKLLTMTKHVHIDAMEAFVEEARHRLLTAAPRLPGYQGNPFITYHGEVSEDASVRIKPGLSWA
ncbi:MAG TPA: hypothetical protein VGM14_08840, partial [Streptosporangiaceae bacterium]